MLRRKGGKAGEGGVGPKAGTDPGKRKRLRKLDGRIRVVAGEAWATVREGWEGAIRVALVVANFAGRDVTLEDVRLRHVRVGPTHLSDPRGFFDERGLLVPSGGVARAFLDLRMGADDVARLRRGFEPAPNRSSSPKVDMECAGDLVLRRRIRSHEQPFLLEHLAVVWTVAEAPSEGEGA